jgi:inner membrane protein
VATVFSHAIAGFAIAAVPSLSRRPAPLWLAGALCAAAPDLDLVGLAFGVPWGHVLGHRGITHSLAFAAGLAALVVWVGFRAEGRRAVALWAALFAATASHGMLDAMTDGGSGVAFFAPFDDARHFLPWRPIPVSPIGVSRFFTERGLIVLRAELRLIWLPAGVVIMAIAILRARGRRA